MINKGQEKYAVQESDTTMMPRRTKVGFKNKQPFVPASFLQHKLL